MIDCRARWHAAGAPWGVSCACCANTESRGLMNGKAAELLRGGSNDACELAKGCADLLRLEGANCPPEGCLLLSAGSGFPRALFTVAAASSPTARLSL